MPSKELIFLLDGDCIKLGISEIKALASGSLDPRGQIALLSGDIAYKRLALSKIVCRKLCEGSSLKEVCADLDGRKYRSFAVSALRLSGNISKRKAEKEIGSCIEGRVDLETPETKVHVFLGKKIIVGEEIYDRRESGFAQRLPALRPAFHPVTMKPLLARAMVNLSGIKKGRILLDPFCGVGGILIEAGLVGCKIKGRDLDPKMVQACRKNLKHYRIGSEISEGNALDIRKGYDCLVTDLPYGRAASLFRKNRSELYRKFLERVEDTLGNGKAVIGSSIDLRKKTDLACTDFLKIRVHKGLERKIHVFSSKK